MTDQNTRPTPSSRITHAELLEALEYDPQTGNFTRKVSAGNYPVGSISGSLNEKGYVIVRLKNRNYKAHRLAWLYVTGEWPADEIDHVDGVKDNNAFSNLREATRTQNNANMRTPTHNTSGFKGVSLHKVSGKWRAGISINNSQKHIGVYDTPEEAYAAYIQTAKRVHGEFARYDPPRVAEGSANETR